uniref:Serine aminopeptidase S33 domain-containing protein n=1 Tax=Phaeomonas parva TaxID=124430 RepID=A0A7S1U097_9STRA|mmetsp:Transcript_25466/g.79752  ORF Transcript_25466/g.79752 Transcript_25466/m.79752 type:complete len:299 (+) Transcript_25466:229-1125(+)
MDDVQNWEARKYSGAIGTNYRIRGPQSGERVVCIHGNHGYSYVYDSLANRLAQTGFKVMTYDLLGRGHSMSSPTYAPEDLVEQLRSLLSETGWLRRPIHIIAHGLGAMVGILFTQEHGADSVCSLTLMAPLGYGDEAMLATSCFGCWRRSSVSSAKDEEDQWKKDLYWNGSALEAEIMNMQALQKAHNPHSYLAYVNTLADANTVDLKRPLLSIAKRKDLRLLLLWGDSDITIPADPVALKCIVRIMENQSSHAKLTYKIVTEAAHAFFLEKEDEVFPVIRDFILLENNDPRETVNQV